MMILNCPLCTVNRIYSPAAVVFHMHGTTTKKRQAGEIRMG